MKKKNSGKPLLIIVMVAIILVALFGGYKFLRLTNRKAAHRIDKIVNNIFGNDRSGEEPEGESAAYKQQSTRTYEGKKLYQSCGYVYNDSGEMLSDFQEGNEYGLQIAFDVDRKRGVFTDGRRSYIINADLEIEKTIEGCTTIAICYEGDYVAYSASGGLTLYNVKTGEETLISTTGFSPVLSPDGRTVIFTGFKDWKECIYVANLDKGIREVATVADSSLIKPMAVSNGGETVYYSVIFGEDEGTYCYHDETITQISKKDPRSSYFDRECKTVLIAEDNEVYYYDTSLKEKKVLVKEGYLRDIYIYGTGYCLTDVNVGNKNHIVDTDRFSDVAVISTGSDIYGLWGDVPNAVVLSDGGVFPRQGITTEGPVCIYKDKNKLIKSVNVNGEAVKTEIIPDAKDMQSLEMKADMSGGFFVMGDRNDDGEQLYSLFSFNVGEAPVRIVESGSIGIEQVRWDNLYKKCYYICDGNLYSINDDGTGQKLIGEGFADFSYFYGGDEVPTVENSDKEEFLIIGEEVYKK